MLTSSIGTISYHKIDRPPQATNLSEFLKELARLMDVNQSQLSYLFETLDKNIVISEHRLKKWLHSSEAPIPQKGARAAIHKLITEVCVSDAIRDAWLTRFQDIIGAELKRRDEKKTAKNQVNQAAPSQHHLTDTTTSNPRPADDRSDTTPEADATETPKNRRQPILILAAVALGIIYWVFAISQPKPVDQITTTESTPPLPNPNQVEHTDNAIQARADDLSEPMPKAKPAIQAKPSMVTTIPDSNQHKQPQPNLLMDAYIIGDLYKQLPKTPSGYQILSRVHSGSAPFTFADHLVDDTLFDVAADKDVGLHYHGQLNLDEAGTHLFSLRYQSGRHAVNQLLKKCRIVLNINNEQLIDGFVPIGLEQTKAAEAQVNLKQGANDFNLWFACQNLRSFNPSQDYRTYKDTTLSISHRQPSDSKITLLSFDRFSH
ncbi:hypothetical protein [Ferrimonas aestuarii]|uniref:Uncharacterized protein n=1 Tax=Ferrimonas aestuarii TaxID=2569539 RepID=A0A4U1BQ84_9GAMM|nr:hypothetical protein [Ferrimonas aestuarii]TKB56130.1 hypothetical protein FCL42_07905 [Ferrimonas aestuarii]